MLLLILIVQVVAHVLLDVLTHELLQITAHVGDRDDPVVFATLNADRRAYYE